MFGFTLQGAGIAAASITAIIGCGYAVKKVFRSAMVGLKKAWSEAVDASETGQQVKTTAHLVKYHLGPNGTTTPMHMRMSRLEEAHHIEDTNMSASETLKVEQRALDAGGLSLGGSE